jgi:putative transposase
MMTNHVHLIASPPNSDALSRFVRATAQPYAQRRNRARGGSGKLFEERFKCVAIMTDEQMAITNVYVELNPVRAGICNDPGAYRWSTYAMHAGYGSADDFVRAVWTPSSWFRSLGENEPTRSLVYTDWFEHYRRRDEWKEVASGPARSTDRRRLERPDRRRAG